MPHLTWSECHSCVLAQCGANILYNYSNTVSVVHEKARMDQMHAFAGSPLCSVEIFFPSPFIPVLIQVCTGLKNAAVGL